MIDKAITSVINDIRKNHDVIKLSAPWEYIIITYGNKQDNNLHKLHIVNTAENKRYVFMRLKSLVPGTFSRQIDTLNKYKKNDAPIKEKLHFDIYAGKYVLENMD